VERTTAPPAAAFAPRVAKGTSYIGGVHGAAPASVRTLRGLPDLRRVDAADAAVHRVM
jgi:hypothetical protein